MRRVLMALAAAAALAPAGCGGGDDDEGASVKGLPKPAQPLSAVVSQFEQAIASGRCPQFFTLVHTRDRRANTPPGSPGSGRECRATNLRDFTGFRAQKRREFGTAAVVDGRTNRHSQISLIFVLDSDRRWRVLPTSPVVPSGRDPDIRQASSKPRDDDRFDANAQAFVKGFQDRDCAGIWRSLSAVSGLVTVRGNNQADFCRDLNRSYSARGTFPNLVLQSRDAKPQRLGETSDNAFYALKLAGGNVFTLVLSTDPANLTAAQKRGHPNDGVVNYYRAGRPG
jgi:hypothetical protein